MEQQLYARQLKRNLRKMSEINLPYKDYIKKLYSNYFLKPMKTLEVKYHSERHKHRKI